MRTLVAIDPGGDAGHSGMVQFEYRPDSLPVLVQDAAITDGWRGFANRMPWWGNTVVMEKFVNWNIPGADLSVVRTEGAILSAYARMGIEVVEQTSAGKNTAVPNAALKELGLWFTGDHHHDRTEAARHALVWLRRQRHQPTLEMLLDL